MKQMRRLTWAVVAMMSAFTACSNVEDDELPTGPDKNEGSFEMPYTVEDVIEMNPQGTTPAKTGVWAEGYIVGVRDYSGESGVDDFNAEDGFNEAANVYLAAEANVKDYKKCISIQLPFELRAEVNLKENPDNYGVKLKVKGDVLRYNSVPGIKNTLAYSLNGGDVVEKPAPEVDVVEVCGDALEAKTAYKNDFQTAKDKTDFVEEGWKNLTIQGQRKFQGAIFQENAYLKATAHGAADGKHEIWVITPGLNVDATEKKSFSVDLAHAFYNENTTFEVYALQCIDGATVQTKLDVTLPAADTPKYEFKSTGLVDLSTFKGIVYIGFKYVGDGGQGNSTTWCIDNFEFGSQTAGETTVSLRYENALVERGAALNCTLTTEVENGDGATVITAEGVPSWATFKDNGDGTAAITGTAPAEAGAFPVSVKAVNNGVEAVKEFTIRVVAPSTIAQATEYGTFETWTEGAAQGWYVASTDGTIAQETTTVKDGTSAVRFTEKGTFAQGDRVYLEAGTYTIGYDYYLVSASGTSNLRIWCYLADNLIGSEMSEELNDAKAVLQNNANYIDGNIVETWTRKETVVEIPKACYITLQLRSYKGVNVVVDNFSIVKQ